MAEELDLIVGGKRYSGWKSIRVTRSIEGLTGSFALDVSDRWGQGDPWPIAEGDACRVEIGGEAVIDGYVDKRTLGASKDQRTLSYSGRDRAADLVDCSVLVPDSSTKGNKWTYRNIDIAAFATAIAAPHGIKVSVQSGLTLPKDPLLVAHPGETCFEAINRAAASAGVLVVSDGAGGILITRAGIERAAPLVEGFNILEASADFDATNRFHRYLISSQPPGTDDANGDATRVQAEATDTDVARTNRVILIRPEKGYNTAGARKRADWEARIRAAKSAAVTISVLGWRQPNNGPLWPLNMISHVNAPDLIGVDGDMLISQVEHSIGDGGQITQIKLVRPDAFSPEPQNVPVVSGEALWKEITPTK
jgi:prophage tail gpP-like protein